MKQDDLAPRYRLVGRLGEGGMGVVFRARDQRLNRDVVVKFLADDPALSNTTAVARFTREARACIALQHPSIVKILDVGRIDGRPCYVMEYLQAVDLAHITRSEGPLSVDLVRSVLDQVLDALDYCHRAGFVHRDIKPANILLEASGRAILMDSGAVREVDRSVLTVRGTVVGTLHFIAPEVLRGDTATAQSDLWSLGVTVWELLAGRPMFEGTSIMDIATRVLRQEIPPIESMRPDVGPGLGELVDRLVTRDLGQRWPDAAAARKALAGVGPAAADRRAQRPAGMPPREASGPTLVGSWILSAIGERGVQGADGPAVEPPAPPRGGRRQPAWGCRESALWVAGGRTAAPTTRRRVRARRFTRCRVLASRRGRVPG